MKRDRVYLSKPDRLPFAPDQASALTRLMAVLESSFDGIFITCLLYTSPSPRDT